MHRGLFFSLAVLAATVSPSAASAAPELYGFVGIDAWPSPDPGAHAIFGAELRLPDLIDHSRLTVSFNTDTLTLRIDRACFAEGWCVGARLRGELFIAQVLIDYFVQGINDPRFGIRASYVEATGFIDGDLGGGMFVRYSLGLRKWFFDHSADSAVADAQRVSGDFALPPDFWTLEQRFHFTYWRLENDASLYEAHRLFPRVAGFGFGLTLGLDLRDQAAAWGPLSVGRNDPKQNVYQLVQWMRMGKVLGDRVRVQFAEFSGWQRGGDDLTRTRIGGMNPYVIPLAGTPWGAFVASRYITGELSLPIRTFGEVEIGPVVQAGFVDDTQRTGTDEFEGLVSFGLLLDARFGSWQVDLRGGYSHPGNWAADEPLLSFFASLGWRAL